MFWLGRRTANVGAANIVISGLGATAPPLPAGPEVSLLDGLGDEPVHRPYRLLQEFVSPRKGEDFGSTRTLDLYNLDERANDLVRSFALGCKEPATRSRALEVPAIWNPTRLYSSPYAPEQT